MTPFWAFIIGAVSVVIVLSLIFSVLLLEEKDEAYRKGFEDGVSSMEELE